MSMTRRVFLKRLLFAFTGIGVGGASLGFFIRRPEKRENYGMKEDELEQGVEGKELKAPFFREAMFYTTLSHMRVQCELCFRRCIIYSGERGECRNRENHGGKLFSIVHSRPSAVQIDPIEKEPQYHMLPGTDILCFGTAGCNFHCRFCQNWHLSQQSLEEIGYHYDFSPEAAVEEAKRRGIPTISFTYNEPTSFYEYVYDIARIAKSRGVRILWHSNGAMNPEPLRELLKYTDAVTIDLKGFREGVYNYYSSAELSPVLRNLKIIKSEGVWLEIVNLIIPTVNDAPGDIRRMCEWIRENLGTEVPVHFSRFFPAYKLTKLPPTPIQTLEMAHRVATETGILYATIGNVPGHRLNSTFCPNCGAVLVSRVHFHVLEINIKDGRCSECGYEIPGIWSM
ncbi:MAG: AmmeMemoRadiSam system radical SAM enzyme [Spirochaetota bacterium]